VDELRPLAGGVVPEQSGPRRPWPRAQVVLARTPINRPHTAVIDVHNHVGRWLSHDGSLLGGSISELTTVMDSIGLASLVNLDGRWGDELHDNLHAYDRRAPERISTFCHLDWSLMRLGDADSSEVRAALRDSLADSVRRGARGVKVWKDLGLSVRDGAGKLVLPDDPRVVDVLRAAGEWGLPVLIHSADPVAFFEPLDEHNERLDELTEFPDWWFGREGFPTFDELLAALHRLVAACPGTTFVAAHLGCHAEDLGAVGRALTRLPNLHIDTGGRLAEIGRQPRSFRRLVQAFPDRVLFGSDCFPLEPEIFDIWWRFLETDDENFDYAPGQGAPAQGNWRISGARLSPGLLAAVYHDNAARLLGL
jgi:hypothetical protein